MVSIVVFVLLEGKDLREVINYPSSVSPTIQSHEYLINSHEIPRNHH